MNQPGAVGQSGRRSKSKRIGMTLLAVAVSAVALVAADLLFHLRPIVAEKFWLATLESGIGPLQEQAVRNLREHPTRAVASSLVTFINDKSRSGDFKLARHATGTLCVLTGRTFGADCAKGSRDPTVQAEWPEVLTQINLWAERAPGIGR